MKTEIVVSLHKTVPLLPFSSPNRTKFNTID
jgi:hypothetical protein